MTSTHSNNSGKVVGVRDLRQSFLELPDKYSATIPTKSLLEVIDSLPPERRRPDGTTDAFLEVGPRKPFRGDWLRTAPGC